jgi:ribosomal protein L29
MVEYLQMKRFVVMTCHVESSSVDELESDLLELKKEMQRLRGILNHNFEIIHQIRTTRNKYIAYNVYDIENTEEIL